MDQKIILILGASSQVGIHLIQTIHQDFDIILAHYCNSQNAFLPLLDTMGDKLIPIQADFSSEQETLSFVQHLKKNYPALSYFVHLPSEKLLHKKFHQTGWNLFESQFHVGLRSIVLILQEFLPSMAKAKKGKIVFMLSSVTENMPPGYISSYVAYKYAMAGLMKALSSEYASKNIHINGVSPYMMDTPFLSEIPESVVSHMMEFNPWGKPVSLWDVSHVISYLLSEKSDSIHGQNIRISGKIQ